MINEANASSSACRLWRVHMVETSAPPQANILIIADFCEWSSRQPLLHKIKKRGRNFFQPRS